jgi:hypothetical protein
MEQIVTHLEQITNQIKSVDAKVSIIYAGTNVSRREAILLELLEKTKYLSFDSEKQKNDYFESVVSLPEDIAAEQIAEIEIANAAGEIIEIIKSGTEKGTENYLISLDVADVIFSFHSPLRLLEYLKDIKLIEDDEMMEEIMAAINDSVMEEK